MKTPMRTVLGLMGLMAAAQVSAQVTFYENEGFTGRQFTTSKPVVNFDRYGFNDRASSVVVTKDRWEVCDDSRFNGQCVVLRPGRYPSLSAIGMSDRISSVRNIGQSAQIEENRYAPMAGAPHIIFYENEQFGGRSFDVDQQIGNLARFGFNDRASSAVVFGDRWEVCQNVRFQGRCAVLRPGRYPSLAAMGLNDQVSSVRTVVTNVRVEDNRYAPPPATVYDNRRRGNEHLYEATVTSVRAVVGTPEQRCWVEREQVSTGSGNASIPGALVGALIGGVLGHQIGNGRGRDFATVGGAVAGGAVGASVGGRVGNNPQTQDVQRCAASPGQERPEFWDVTYVFRGQEHRMQMTSPPGPTVTVNEQGEPRA